MVGNDAFAVAEVQGLYGPFSFGEKLLQKIWLRGEFDRDAAKLLDGRALRIVHPGKWNLLGGPDFKSARLSFAGAAEICGDVELHLRAQDWAAHNHANDPAYDNVVLHVVLFPPEAGHVTRGVGGREIPILVLLPLLHHDLEEFAAEEAVELLSGHSRASVPEDLAILETEKLIALLRSHAEKRWNQKVQFARNRVERLGWDGACHQTALEILGYRFNRAPMLRLAEGWPLSAWAVLGFDVDPLWESERGRWSVQGVRPANHPLTRLRQYAAWTQARPNWPERWQALAVTLPVIDATAKSRLARRQHDLGELRSQIADLICADAVGGTRFDNLICDGLLPLAASRTDRGFFGLWFHSFVGDQPPALSRLLRQLNVFDGLEQPACHGFAQGLFSWFIERDAREARKGRGA